MILRDLVISVCESRDGTTQGLRGAMPPPPTFEKKKLVCILTKRILILPPFQKKIYKLTQEIQQIDNKKNLLKKKQHISK